MKQIVSNYTYSPTANCVTLTGVNIDADQLLLIVAPEAGRTLYNFASVTGSVVPGASTRVNLTASTAGLTASSPLVIYYDDQASATSVTGTVALDPASLLALENVTVTIGSSVTVAGTVTANVPAATSIYNDFGYLYGNNTDDQKQTAVPIGFNDTYADKFYNVSNQHPLPIAGTVTANVFENVFIRVYPTGNDWNGGILERVSQTRWQDHAGSAIEYNEQNAQWEARYADGNALYATNPDSKFAVPPLANWGVIIGDNFTISYEKYATQNISGTVTIGSCVTHGVTVANSVTIASLPAISGTVTANLSSSNLNSVTIGVRGAVTAGISSLPVTSVTYVQTPNANFVATDRTLAVFGGVDLAGLRWGPIPLSDDGAAVIATGSVEATQPLYPFTNTPRPYVVTVGNSITIASLPAISGTVTARLQDSTGIGLTSTTVGTTPRLNVTLASAITTGGSLPAVVNVYAGSDSGTVRAVAVDSAGRTVVTVSNFPASQTISGTVTATLASTTVTVSALPSGALTTRFGSVTTANTAQITAVTNTSRKYLLAQNISAGTVTIGIGFSPTTTQGIQLAAGGGLTFDAFCPTGAVYWLGAATGAAFTILEG